MGAPLPSSTRFCSSESSGSQKSSKDGSSGTGGAADGKSESDQRYAEAGEYDTQDAYKRVGNPISWANPTGGGTIEDNTSNTWRWIYPVGVVGILLLCLWSRRKNLRKEQEEQMIAAPQVMAPDTRRFENRYVPPEAHSSNDSDDDYDMDKGPQISGFAGSGGFSAPPSSSQTSNW